MVTNKAKIAFTFAIVTGLVLWMTISGFNENMQYYVSIKDVAAMKDTPTKGLRVKGYLVPGSLVKSPNSLDVQFLIEEDDAQLEVHYDKELPDTFKDGAEVLVEGKLAPQGYFAARILMAKCPSKYESTEGYAAQQYDELHN